MAVADYPMFYDVGTSTLTIIGNSEENAYTKMGYSEETAFDFDDIKDYLLYINSSLGIDVVRDDGYEFDCRFVFAKSPEFGDNTYFIDNRKLVKFNKVGISPNIYLFDINEGVYWRIGTITDAEQKISADGCAFFINQLLSYNGGIKHKGFGGVYSSYITAGYYGSTSCIFGDWDADAQIWNTKLENGGLRSLKNNTDVYNLSIERAGLSLYYTSGIYDKLSVTDGYCFGRVRNLLVYSVTAKNVYARNNQFFVYFYDATDGVKVDITDGDIDVWDTYTGYIRSGKGYVYRRYTFNLKIKDSEGNVIEGAHIRIINNADEEVYNGYSGEDGSMDEQILLVNKWEYEGEPLVQTFFDYNPFKILVEMDGYFDYTTYYDILSKTENVITLTNEIPPVYYKGDLTIELADALTVELTEVEGLTVTLNE